MPWDALDWYSRSAAFIARRTVRADNFVVEIIRLKDFCSISSCTFNPQTKKAGYYTIEMTAEKEVRALGQILPDGRHESLGEAPVEGAELQKIMDLARYDGTEMTS